MAAMISVPESMEKPVECVEINTVGTLIILEEAAAAGGKKLCFASSAANYGNNPVIPKVETMLPEPGSPYAVTKLGGEYYCNMFKEEGKLDTVCMRFFNVFGPRQDPGSAYAAAVPIFIDKALKGEAITIFGDGEQTRDFIYVKDIVAASVFLAMNDTESGFFNVACGGCLTINDVARKIIELTGSSSAIEYAPERPGDVKHSMASVEKLRKAGFVPTFGLDEGLQETLRYFQGMRKSAHRSG
jgi:UDP-glucose 4-epimerase